MSNNNINNTLKSLEALYLKGDFDSAIELQKKEGATFNYQLNNCLLKFDNTSNQYTNHPEYQFNTDPLHYSNIIQNKDPKFLNISENKLNIDNSSAAFAKGSATYLIPLDILGINRTLPPDLGAYQNQGFAKK